MTDTLRPDGTSTVPWLTSDPRVQVPDTSMLPSGEQAPPAPSRELHQAVQAKTDALRRGTDAWLEELRTTVRGNPLLAVAAALALGAVVARLSR